MTITRLAQFTAETRVVTDITFFAGTPAVSSTQAKTGTYSYSRGLGSGLFGKALDTPVAAIRLGFWMYMNSTTINGNTYLYYGGHGLSLGNTSNFVTLHMDSGAGELRLIRHNSASGGPNEELATATLPSAFSTTGTWFHVGITHKVDSVSGFFSVYINGVLAMNYTGDTRPAHWSGSQTFQTTLKNILVAGASTTSGSTGFTGAYVDDFYIDSYVDEVDAIVPSRRFLMVLPDGAGADAEWTGVSGANYANVDENPNTGDTDYNKALSADLRDTFTYGNVTLPVDHNIVAVLPSPFAKRLDSELAHQLSVHAWDGVQYGDSADLDLTMSYDVPVFARLTTQPDGSAWNETDFNAMQFGYRSRGTF